MAWKGIMTGRIGLAAGAIALWTMAAFAPQAAAQDAEAEWREWKAGLDASYSTDRFAVLKVNDAVFLKPGQTAWLMGKPGDPSSCRWSLERSTDAVLHVDFGAGEGGGFKASLTHGKQRLDALAQFAGPGYYPLTDVIDLQGRVTGEGTEDPRLQLKIFNQDHPAAKAFKGLAFFDFAPDYRFEAKFVRAAKPEAVILETERGLRKRFYRHGDARFTLEGTSIRLPLYAQEADAAKVHAFFTPFMDQTTGKETYGVGRYMDIEAPGKDAPRRVMIDFNRAYNPLCARSPHYNCPLVELQLPVAIRAGEKYPGKASARH